MFYGIQKSKSTKELSEFEKYSPWESGKYGGTISFFNNKQTIEIYRDFNNNTANIIDEKGNNISDKYDLDKGKGIIIGTTEFKTDSETFENVFLVKQKSVNYNSEQQKSVVQKIVNYLQSGEEDFSYNEKKRKLEKVLNEEIGTDRTTTKPKNILSNEIKKLENKMDFLKEKRKELDINRQNELSLKTSVSNIKKDLETLKLVYNEKKQFYQKLTDEKIKYEAKVEALREKEKEIHRKNNINKKIDAVMLILSFVIMTIALIIIEKFFVIPIVMVLIPICYFINNKYSYKESFDYDEEGFKARISEIRLDESKKMKDLVKNGIDKTYTDKAISELNNLIISNEEEYNNLLLHLRELESSNTIIEKELEEESITRVELTNKKEEYNQLLDKEKMIRLAISKLEEASEDIKKTIVPGIEKKMGEVISLITNGKYNQFKYSSNNGMLIKNAVGNYIPLTSLSAGTMEQVYIGFRIAVCDTYENIPIVFDESFVYADDERLLNILMDLSVISEYKQIIIISCTNRECKLMDSKRISYNKIVF